MRKRGKNRSGPTVRTLAVRLAAVIAVLLAVRTLSDSFDGPLSLPDGLGTAVMALELPGAGPALPGPGAAALLAALPGAGEDTKPPATEPSGADTQPTEAALPSSPSEPTAPSENTGPTDTSPTAPGASTPPRSCARPWTAAWTA